MSTRTWDNITLHHSDCLDVLRALPDESVDAIVTDPPYGLAKHKPERITAALVAWTSGDRDHVPAGSGGFMNRAWDTFVPPPAVWDECLRVLKPGGHLAAFAGSRTYDLMGMSIRLAGFEIRDGLQWLYGSGMPKGQNVGKAIDKAAGAERSVPRSLSARGEGFDPKGALAGRLRATSWCEGCGRSRGSQPANCQCDTAGAPATPEAARWEGWNTALKPSQEPIVLARKPIRGTVAANVLATGCGALNVDACRVQMSDADREAARVPMGEWTHSGTTGATAQRAGRTFEPAAAGRWPANVLLSHDGSCHEPGECAPGCVVAELDAQSGITTTSKPGSVKRRAPHGGHDTLEGGTLGTLDRPEVAYGDEGGASRFFPTFRHDETGCAPGCPVAELDAQEGGKSVNASARYVRAKSDAKRDRSSYVIDREGGDERPGYDDSGGASRFFPSFRYQAKAPASERPKIYVPPAPVLRLRENLTDEQRDYVLGELTRRGVDVA